MTGKERCEFLRNIRKNIAEMNDLDYTPSVCTHEGWCPGFCPVCDREAADLMRQLERKEAAGCQIHIDVESIKALDAMAKDSFNEDDDDDPEILKTPGIVAAPNPERFYMGETASPFAKDPEEVKSEYENRSDESLELEVTMDDVIEVCKGCLRFDTIRKVEGKPVRCAALSEHFFCNAITQGTCRIKKTTDEDDGCSRPKGPIPGCGGG